MTKLAFHCLAGPWSALGETYTDHVELEDATSELVRVASHAHAAGVLEVSEGLDLSDLQSQEDGEQALAEAMGDWVEPVRDPETGQLLLLGYWNGPWTEGHLANAALEANAKAEAAVEVEAGESA